MIDKLSILIAAALLAFTAPAAHAQAGKAPCSAFQKLPNGNWTVAQTIKIEHGSASATLNPGLIVSPGTQAAGVNLYAALQKNCH